MAFGAMNYVAVVVAAAAGFVFGAVYYMSLGRIWMVALGKTAAELRPGGMARPMLLTALAQLVMAYMLAGVIGHLGAGQATLGNGLVSGFFLWLGFSLTVIAANYAWQRASPALTVIDGLHWLGVLLIQGAVVGLFG